MPLLSREQIQDANDLGFEDLPVPEWGGEVRIKKLTVKERERFEMASMQGKGRSREVNMKAFRERLVIFCCVDEQGHQLFDKSDLLWLSGKSALALTRVYDKAMSLNGFTKEDEAELTGNSQDDQDDDSNIVSPQALVEP
jgi:hypothetical protein